MWKKILTAALALCLCLSAAACGIPFIITTDSLTVFVDQFENVPATILVDKKGRIVGSVFGGEDIAGYRTAVGEYLDGLK